MKISTLFPHVIGQQLLRAASTHTAPLFFTLQGSMSRAFTIGQRLLPLKAHSVCLGHSIASLIKPKSLALQAPVTARPYSWPQTLPLRPAGAADAGGPGPTSPPTPTPPPSHAGPPAAGPSPNGAPPTTASSLRSSTADAHAAGAIPCLSTVWRKILQSET